MYRNPLYPPHSKPQSLAIEIPLLRHSLAPSTMESTISLAGRISWIEPATVPILCSAKEQAGEGDEQITGMDRRTRV